MKRLHALMFLGLGLAACRAEPFEDPPIAPIRNMWHQERYNPQDKSAFFPDNRTMREPVKGTVSQEHYLENEEVQTGLAEDGTYALTVPKAAVDHFGNMQKTLERGQQRFNIYCTPCHDKTGSGNGAVIVRAAGSFPKPPKFSDARIKQMPDGQLYATITNGVRTMPSYAAQVPVWDRWAIVSYVRALQLSDATLSTNAPAPPEKKGP